MQRGEWNKTCFYLRRHHRSFVLMGLEFGRAKSRVIAVVVFFWVYPPAFGITVTRWGAL